MELSILIPAYNEAFRIRAMLEDYCAATAGREVELLVVVNGSRDATERIVREAFMPRFPHLRMIVIPEPVGKGGALMRGLSESRGDKVGYTDADGSTPAAFFLAMADRLEGSGLLIASRWLPGAKINRRQPRHRLVSSRVFNRMVRTAFGLEVTDTQCGAKVMSRDVLETILPRVGVTQWAFDVDLLFHVRRAGFPVREVPAEWNDVSGSKVRYFRAPLEMTAALARLRMIHSPLRGLVRLWDQTLGARLYARRLARMRAIYAEEEAG